MKIDFLSHFNELEDPRTLRARERRSRGRVVRDS